MRHLSSTRLQPLAAALLLLGCGEEPGRGSGVDSGSDAAPPVTPSAWINPPVPVCPGKSQGTGAVWLDDPADMSLAERPLYCLAGDGRLRGTFVASLDPDAWAPAQDAGLRFVYPAADPHLHEVQIYYAVTGMAGYYQQTIRSPAVLAPLRVTLLSAASFTVSRFDLPDRLQIALRGVRPAMMPVQVLCHEYAHQIILRHAARVDQLINEGMADYLTADFTGNPRVLALDRLEVPSSVSGSPTALEVARRYLERTVDNQRSYPADLVTMKQYCDTLAEAARIFPAGSPLIPAEKLALCTSMSAAELAQPEPHRTGMILAGALWELRGQLGSAALNALLFATLSAGGSLELRGFVAAMIEAGRKLDGGSRQSVLESVGRKRGLL